LHARVLRRYQSDLLNTGTFSVISPYSARQVAAQSGFSFLGGISTHSTQIAYHFFDQSDFWLLTNTLATGHQLAEVIVDRCGQRFYLTPKGREKTCAIGPVELGWLRQRSEQARAAGIGARTLIIGHRNFAHLLWNELPALDAWMAEATDEAIAKLSVVALAEPLGPLRDIFPRLTLAKVRSPSQRLLQRESMDTGLVVRVGSVLVTSRVRKLVWDYTRTRENVGAIAEVNSALTTHWPRIWVSVRSGSRTPDNQEAFLQAVIRRIFGEYPDAAIVFDGFSYPVDFFADNRTKVLREPFVARAESTAATIQSLSRIISHELGEKAGSSLYSISGLGLPEAFSVGSKCDFYICHGGTLQHKIHWMHNKPGFVHCHHLERRSAQWYACQVEGGQTPDVLPERLAVPSGVPTDPLKPPEPRHLNYIITDIEEASKCVIASMRRHLNSANAA